MGDYCEDTELRSYDYQDSLRCLTAAWQVFVMKKLFFTVFRPGYAVTEET